MTGLETFGVITALVISSAALALEVRRWIESGPRISLRVMPDVGTYPDDDGKDKFSIIVTNRGDLPTQITHMLAQGYATRWKRILRQPNAFMMIMPANGPTVMTAIPFKLEPGDIWSAIGYYDERLISLREGGLLEVGIHCSHRDRPFLFRMPKRPKDKTGDDSDKPN